MVEGLYIVGLYGWAVYVITILLALGLGMAYVELRLYKERLKGVRRG